MNQRRRCISTPKKPDLILTAQDFTFSTGNVQSKRWTTYANVRTNVLQLPKGAKTVQCSLPKYKVNFVGLTNSTNAIVEYNGCYNAPWNIGSNVTYFALVFWDKPTIEYVQQTDFQCIFTF